MVLGVQHGLQQLVVEACDRMNKLDSNLIFLYGRKALTSILQHLAVQTVLGQGRQYLRPVIPLDFIGCPHPLAPSHHLKGTVCLSLQVKADIDSCKGDRAGCGRGQEEGRERGWRLG
jgi:hypothetical protein